MSRNVRVASALAIAALASSVAAIPAGAQSASSSTSSGVQIIDMNPQPQKKSAIPKPKASPAEQLPGGDVLVRTAMAYVGSPYRKGGLSPSGFDAAGFTQFAFAAIGVRIPRQANQQFYAGKPIAADAPLPGDLVFFQTDAVGPSGVAIYIGNGRFLSAIGSGVRVDSFQSDYFRSRYLGARRYL